MAIAAPIGSSRRRATRSARAEVMSLSDHLTELRRRVVVSGIALVFGTTVMFILYGHVLGFLLQPYCTSVGHHGACVLYVTGPLDGLAIRVKVAAYGGLLLASPVLLWQFWRFVAPGLHAGERRYAAAFVAASVTLFAGGAAVAYAVFPHTLAFLDAVGGPDLRQLYSPSSYIGLLVLMMAAFGATFELPVLLVALELAGVVSPAQLASWRRWSIVGLVTFAAVITPSSDPFSMLALAVPLIVLYEVAIVIGRLARRARRTHVPA
jgi:sec-independent protein translocase protein TatC